MEPGERKGPAFSSQEGSSGRVPSEGASAPEARGCPGRSVRPRPLPLAPPWASHRYLSCHSSLHDRAHCSLGAVHLWGGDHWEWGSRGRLLGARGSTAWPHCSGPQSSPHGSSPQMSSGARLPTLPSSGRGPFLSPSTRPSCLPVPGQWGRGAAPRSPTLTPSGILGLMSCKMRRLQLTCTDGARARLPPPPPSTASEHPVASSRNAALRSPGSAPPRFPDPSLAVPATPEPRTPISSAQAPQVVRRGWRAGRGQDGGGGRRRGSGVSGPALPQGAPRDAGEHCRPPQRRRSHSSSWWCPSPARRGTSRPRQRRSGSCGCRACRPRSSPACRAAAAPRTRWAWGPEPGRGGMGAGGGLAADRLPRLSRPAVADATGEPEPGAGRAGRPHRPRQQLLHRLRRPQ